MAGTVHRRSLSFAAALALPVAMLLGAAGGANSPTLGAVVHSPSAVHSHDCAGVTQSKITYGTTPILFVHGINSDPTIWNGTDKVDGTGETPLIYVQTALGSNKVTGYTFDWSRYSGWGGSQVMWVTDSHLGAGLAQAISCVARKAGHQVIIIAHSMGGLIAKEASRIDQKDIAAIFTIGTPYQGSWLASAAVGKDTDWGRGLLVQAISDACSIRLPSTNSQPPKRHTKPSGLITALCNSVNSLMKERNDPGVEAMRLDGGPNGGWSTLLWPPGLRVYALASGIQGIWQPLWPLGLQVPLTSSGDVIVSTSSQQVSPKMTLSCPVRLRGPLPMPDVLPLLDAVAAVPCFHTNEPHNKTWLDDIIGVIQTQRLLPTANVGSASSPARSIDWYNTSYTSTCGGAAPHPFSVNVQNGKGTAPGGSQDSYQHYDVQIEAVKYGDLTGNGRPDTAVLFYCSPQPSNFFLEDVQVFGPDNKLLAELPHVSTLKPTWSALPPQYVPSEFSISGGQLIAGMKFYTPTDAHASGPSLHRTLIWKWNGSQFVLLSPGIDNIWPATDVLALLQQLAMQHCQSASVASECTPGGAKISKIDSRYGVGIADATGQHGTIYMRPSASSTAFTPVISIGGDVPACSQVQAVGVPTAVFNELLGQACLNV